MSELAPPPGVLTTRYVHRVPFYETDAMGLVHHANYVRFFELARIRWMDEHHRPYREYVAEGLHFATTRVEVDYLRGLRFDDEVEIAVWLAWARGVRAEHERRPRFARRDRARNGRHDRTRTPHSGSAAPRDGGHRGRTRGWNPVKARST
jgi:YbgC/YbaW family acyl-CoA thioester hydrolase